MNEIIDEIHRYRAEHARECNYDVDVIFARMNEDRPRLEQEGWRFVTLAPRRPAKASERLRDDSPEFRASK